MRDTYRHKGLRKRLVDTIESKGIGDKRILRAIKKIPRHWFLDRAFEEKAYLDLAFPIGKSQTISQPYTVAFQTELLDIRAGEKVLEIGTGSGYQACVLAELGVDLYTIERHKSLAQRADRMMTLLGYDGVKSYYGDGFLGLPELAPFDKIIVTAASDSIPQALVDQLRVGGYMVIPEGSQNGSQTMIRLRKKTKAKVTKERFGQFRFVPMVSGVE